MILQIFPDLLMTEAEKVLHDLQYAWDGDNGEGFKEAKEKIANMLDAAQKQKGGKVVVSVEDGPRWIDGKGVFVPVINKVVAPKDLPEEVNWNDAMKATEGHMGSKRDWAFIYAWKDEINGLLAQNGAEPIKDDWYWTETEYSATHAWALYFGTGIQSRYRKSTYRYRVRPVSAL